MQKNPIGWFEIPVKDMDRAENFYKEFFGFEMKRQEETENGVLMSWFPGDMESYGSTGALAKHSMYEPSHNGTAVYFTVPNVREATAKAKEMGCKVFVEHMNIGEHGYIGIIRDTEGNSIAVHSMAG